MATALMNSQSDDRILSLYKALLGTPEVAGKLKWKDSIKTVVGLEVPTEPGLDI